ncbi:hypothetical protein J4G43_047230 [Bradyrhizobium barranii subsp. barranii]|uniref:Uncharacterized protein n=1 Tax=Bradyrhizobium barranii subsp. barranii TaxID=2823807 RepID=A0A9X9XWB7_9BRAD|nr:hypothetical protein [Bradyrhizobium barranii]UEM11961.1 hypothetical protein J4G43_047230 [Bradyrhizobium barranii subsp. barranii]
MKAASPFAEGSVNYEGDIVTHHGSTYQARCDTARPPPHGDWACVAAAGRNASMPLVCGTYREGEAYKFLNIVALNGSAFAARCDDPGPCPGDGWQLIASAGRAGKPGPKGERGEPGPRGLPGANAAAIVRWEVNRAAYTITPIMADGSQAPSINVRELFEQYHEESDG